MPRNRWTFQAVRDIYRDKGTYVMLHAVHICSPIKITILCCPIAQPRQSVGDIQTMCCLKDINKNGYCVVYNGAGRRSTESAVCININNPLTWPWCVIEDVTVSRFVRLTSPIHILHSCFFKAKEIWIDNFRLHYKIRLRLLYYRFVFFCSLKHVSEIIYTLCPPSVTVLLAWCVQRILGLFKMFMLAEFWSLMLPTAIFWTKQYFCY